jgi:predicted HD phosphohydrolase/alpha-ketoglutarate-dependent taurine dioxygenase
MKLQQEVFGLKRMLVLVVVILLLSLATLAKDTNVVDGNFVAKSTGGGVGTSNVVRTFKAEGVQNETDPHVSEAVNWDVHGDSAGVRLATISADGIGVTLSTPELSSWLHAEWLRERCLSQISADSITKQPLKSPHEYPPPRIASADVREGQVGVESGNGNCSSNPNFELHITFQDGHESVYSLQDLAARYQGESGGKENFAESASSTLMQVQKAVPPPLVIWDANLTAPSVINWSELTDSTIGNAPFWPAQRKAVALLLSTGIVLVRDAPQRSGECANMATVLSTLRTTEWGAEFNVRTKPDTEYQEASAGTVKPKYDLAYTAQRLGMHTDNPYRYPTPDYQLLHAIKQCSCYTNITVSEWEVTAPCAQCNVMNAFVDGFAVLQRMADETPELFDALTDTPVRFENDGGDAGSAIWHVAPHVELKPEYRSPGNAPRCRGAACVLAIRFSAKSGGYSPAPGSAAEMDAFFKARRRFSELVHDPAMGIQMQLRPGDIVVFDNTRLLHSRSSIVASDGERHVQGCYMNRDGLKINYERLRRVANDQQQNGTDGSGVPASAWHALSDTTKEDTVAMGDAYEARVESVLATTLLDMVRKQHGIFLAQPVDLMEHALQTATRALRAGEPEEVVVASLLHDATESIAAKNHGGVMAALLEPYVSPKITWMLREHEVFQSFYYVHHFGGDRNVRDVLLDTVEDKSFWHFTKKWCDEYDQASFDPTYPSLSLETFEPMVHSVLSKPAYWWTDSHPKNLTVTGA